MLKNYFKIAIAVLKRRKFFTFISLFGISFTLTILIVLTAFLDHLFNSAYPDRKRDRSLYINTMQLRHEKNGFQTNGPPSFYYLDTYVKSMKTPEKIAIASIFSPSNTYVKNRKLVINLKYTNADYWQVLEYDFLEGRPFTQQQITNGERVGVISEETRDKYFGKNILAAGKYIETDNVSYRVIGVVKNVPVTSLFNYGDLYLPYTLSKKDYRGKSLTGEFTAILLAKSASDIPAIQEEYRQMLRKVPLKGMPFNQIFSAADSYPASLTRTILGRDDSSGMTTFIIAVGIFVFLFMLLPTLNLVNINVSRIMERSSEIGVRKAFGASSGTLVYQFIIENLILTGIGGIIGVVFSFIVIQLFNQSELIGNLELGINFTVLGYALLACLVFGIFSGVYPAWRMSRIHVVRALKAY